MIASDDAFLLFRKWANESTPMRFDGQSSLYSFSLTGTLESAENEVVRFRVNDLGYIEIHLPSNTGFGYFDPDPMHVDPADRIGEGYKGEPVITGSGMYAIKQTGEEFLFIEIMHR